MFKLPTIALIASLFLISCGGGGSESDDISPTIKVISPVEGATIISGNNIELNIEITDNKNILPRIPKAVINLVEAIKIVNDNFSPWTINYPNATVTPSEVKKTGSGYRYTVSVSIPTKTEEEEYAPPGKYKLEVWDAVDNAGNTTSRDDSIIVNFNIEFPPL